MPQTNRNKPLGLMLAVMLALGLLAFAAFNLLKDHLGGGGGGGGGGTVGTIPLKGVMISDAPPNVRDAAAQLATSKVGYVIPQGTVAYVVVSAGTSGQGMEFVGATRTGSIITVAVRPRSDGDRVLIGMLETQVTDTRTVQFDLAGQPQGIPALINPDNLPLVPLPDQGSIVLVKPITHERLSGTAVEVAGYARVDIGKLNAAIYKPGKSEPLGEVQNVFAAAGSPNWGSFRVTVPVAALSTATDAMVLVYDTQTDSKVQVPITLTVK